MDPVTAVGLTVSLLQIISTIEQVLQYISDVESASNDRAKLIQEALSLLSLLHHLKFKVENTNSSDPWFTSIRWLGTPQGPLEQMKGAMDELATLLRPELGIKKIGKKLVWSRDSKKCIEILNKIERLKTDIALAVQNDLFTLALSTRDEIRSSNQSINRNLCSATNLLECIDTRLQMQLQPRRNQHLRNINRISDPVFCSSSKLPDNSLLRFMGIVMAYTVVGVEERKDCMLSFSTKFPLFLFWWKILLLEFVFCQYPRFWGVSLLWGNITIRNIVSTDAPVIKAAKRGDLDEVRRLFNCGKASPNDASADCDCPLIVHAIVGKNVELVRYLLNLGVDPNGSVNFWQLSPLQVAYICNNAEMSRFLINMGASVHYIDGHETNILTYCWFDGRHYGEDHTEMIEILAAQGFNHFNRTDLLDWAVHQGSVKDIRKLATLGTSLYDQDSFPIALQYAVKYYNLPVLKDLLEHHKLREHINRENSKGQTVFDIACKAYSKDTAPAIALLKANGAKPASSRRAIR